MNIRHQPAALAIAAGLTLSLSVSAAAKEKMVFPPIVLAVQTVPPVSGVTLVLDGTRSFVSNENGALTADVHTTGVHTISLTLPPDTDRIRYTFVRWSDESFSPFRQIRIHRNLTISAGLRVAYLTRIVFADPDGSGLDSTRVSQVVLTGPDAQRIRMDYPYPPVWLQTPLPAKHMGDDALHVNAVPYAISTVDYDGLNVASQGQERYLPRPGGTWVVHLRLYRLTLRAKDALFGMSLGRTVTLTDPAGHRRELRLDRHGQVSLVVGRGNYSARVQAAGISPLVPIALSRNQTADVPVITPLDLTVLGCLTVFTLSAVFAVGRGRQGLRAAIRRR